MIVASRLDEGDISKIVELSQLYITLPSKFIVVDVEYQHDGPHTTCTTTVRRFKLRDMIRSSALKIAIDQIGVALMSKVFGDTKIAQRKQSYAVYQTPNSSCSTIGTEDYRSAVSRLPKEDRQSLVSCRSEVTYHTAQSGRGSALATDARNQRLKK